MARTCSHLPSAPGARGQSQRGRPGPLRALALVAGLALGAASSCRLDPDKAPAAMPPNVTLQGVQLRTYRGDRLVARGQAERLVYDRVSSDFEARACRLELPSRSSRDGSRVDVLVTAPTARGNVQAETAQGEGGVTMEASSGVRASTPSARYDGVAKSAHGSETVWVRGPGYLVDAEGFTADLSTEQVTFERNVRSRVGRAP